MKLSKAWIDGPARFRSACNTKPQTPTPASTSSTPAHSTRNPFDTRTQEGCDQKSHRDGTGYDWSPLQPVEETVSGVVSEAENEVSDKALRAIKTCPKDIQGSDWLFENSFDIITAGADSLNLFQSTGGEKVLSQRVSEIGVWPTRGRGQRGTKNKGGFWPPLLKSEVRSLTSALRGRRPFAAFGAAGLKVRLDYLLYSVVGLDRRDDLRQFLTVDYHFDLRRVEHFAFDQRQRDSNQDLAVGLQQVFGGIISALDQLLHFGVDLDRRGFAVIAMLRNLAA